MFSVTRLYKVKWMDIKMVIGKGFGRKLSWHNQTIIPVFAWRERGKPRKTSVTIADVPAKVQTEHLQNTSKQ
jgi:hypothetical protein